jgi:hypothetical protein
MNSNGFARQISSPNTGVKPVLEGTEEYHEKTQSWKSMSRTRFEPGTSRIYCKAEVPMPRSARLYCVVCGHVCKFYIVYNKINQFMRLGETFTEIFAHHRLWPFVRKGWTSLLYSGTGNASQSGLVRKKRNYTNTNGQCKLSDDKRVVFPHYNYCISSPTRNGIVVPKSFNLSPRNVATESRSNLTAVPGKLWNTNWIAQLPNSQMRVSKGECRFHFYSSESKFSAMKILKSKYSSSLTDEHLNDCTRVGITKYTTHYKTAEDMHCQALHSNLFE